MKPVFRFVCMLALAMAIMGNNHAVAAETKTEPGIPEPEGRETVQSLPFGDQSTTGFEASEALPGLKKGMAEKRLGLDRERQVPEVRIRKKELDLKQKKGSILVKFEPEDGMVSLTWSSYETHRVESIHRLPP